VNVEVFECQSAVDDQGIPQLGLLDDQLIPQPLDQVFPHPVLL
jgi:hypothetical protein